MPRSPGSDPRWTGPCSSACPRTRHVAYGSRSSASGGPWTSELDALVAGRTARAKRIDRTLVAPQRARLGGTLDDVVREMSRRTEAARRLGDVGPPAHRRPLAGADDAAAASLPRWSGRAGAGAAQRGPLPLPGATRPPSWSWSCDLAGILTYLGPAAERTPRRPHRVTGARGRASGWAGPWPRWSTPTTARPSGACSRRPTRRRTAGGPTSAWAPTTATTAPYEVSVRDLRQDSAVRGPGRHRPRRHGVPSARPGQVGLRLDRLPRAADPPDQHAGATSSSSRTATAATWTPPSPRRSA